jgi:RNA polymerase sigma factor (sigma-70 family)
MDLTCRTTDTQATDGTLLSRFAASGDQHAFSELIRRHGPMVLRICRRAADGDPHAAEDAAQQVFLTLAERARQLQTRTSVAGWLYRTAWHVATRQRRERGVRADYERRAAAHREAEAHGGVSAEPVPFAVVTSELSDALNRALGSLPEDQRNALVLHHFAGHTVAKTAEILGVPTGTAASWLSRGRAMLRAQLDALGFAVAIAAVSSWLAEQEWSEGEYDAGLDSPMRMARPSGPAARALGATGSVGAGAVMPWSTRTIQAVAAIGALATTASKSAAAGGTVFGISKAAAVVVAVAVSATTATAVSAIANRLASDTPASSKKPERAGPPSPPPSASYAWTAGAAVPEPSTAAILLGIGSGALLRRRRRPNTAPE